MSMGNNSKQALDATILDRLYKVIESRRGADPEKSNTARLFAKGTDKIAQKLGEEAVETLIEGIRGRKKDLALESADLLYHLLVLWADRRLRPVDVWAALAAREGISGVQEKRSRKG
jgi:phosphoribosyl-ATP pyrophosphohydrolase